MRRTDRAFTLCFLSSRQPWGPALALGLALALPLSGPASGQTAQSGKPLLSPEILFVTSTGFWQEMEDPNALLDPQGSAAPDGPPSGPKGYYKLIALRQPDGTAQIHLQQIALEAQGPRIVTSAELEEFTRMHAYVTDIRPENSDGITRQPGLFATVYLKTDPQQTETESWTVLIDDIGDIRIERETN
ncbi:hypothetical protein [Rhizobium rhizosphaerae]|uniref:hypothetical protein n=1 Tax=Xaviernesmea rhizosphaerae TaxID=1672749 RepID=UPI001FD99429|nr:hypothetical protein [Xaviernesmea rhizosphaerae]